MVKRVIRQPPPKVKDRNEARAIRELDRRGLWGKTLEHYRSWRVSPVAMLRRARSQEDAGMPVRVTLLHRSDGVVRKAIGEWRKAEKARGREETNAIERLKEWGVWDKKTVQRHVRKGFSPVTLARNAGLQHDVGMKINLKILHRSEGYIRGEIRERKREQKERQKAIEELKRIGEWEKIRSQIEGYRGSPVTILRKVRRFKKAKLEVPVSALSRSDTSIDRRIGDMKKRMDERRARERAIRKLKEIGAWDNTVENWLIRKGLPPTTILRRARMFTHRRLKVLTSTLNNPDAEVERIVEQHLEMRRERRRNEGRLRRILGDRGVALPSRITKDLVVTKAIERIRRFEEYTGRQFRGEWDTLWGDEGRRHQKMFNMMVLKRRTREAVPAERPSETERAWGIARSSLEVYKTQGKGEGNRRLVEAMRGAGIPESVRGMVIRDMDRWALRVIEEKMPEIVEAEEGQKAKLGRSQMIKERAELIKELEKLPIGGGDRERILKTKGMTAAEVRARMEFFRRSGLIQLARDESYATELFVPYLDKPLGELRQTVLPMLTKLILMTRHKK
jgi:hypothetical protein